MCTLQGRLELLHSVPNQNLEVEMACSYVGSGGCAVPLTP